MPCWSHFLAPGILAESLVVDRAGGAAGLVKVSLVKGGEKIRGRQTSLGDFVFFLFNLKPCYNSWVFWGFYINCNYQVIHDCAFF